MPNSNCSRHFLLTTALSTRKPARGVHLLPLQKRRHTTDLPKRRGLTLLSKIPLSIIISNFIFKRCQRIFFFAIKNVFLTTAYKQIPLLSNKTFTYSLKLAFNILHKTKDTFLSFQTNTQRICIRKRIKKRPTNSKDRHKNNLALWSIFR